MYAYEVDGLGKFLADFDDPNLPSLLAMPLLNYDKYDRQVYLCIPGGCILVSYKCGVYGSHIIPYLRHQVYNTTRSRILSKRNAFYYEGKRLRGLGSPHTNWGWVGLGNCMCSCSSAPA